MPTDEESGLVEPDIVVNGRALTFAECMAVRVAVGSFRISLTSGSLRAGLGKGLANNYDRLLSSVEQTMLRGKPHEGAVEPKPPLVGWGDKREKL